MFKKIKKYLIHDAALVVYLLLISGFFYISTLSPAIYIEDSAEFVASAVTLSIPHPSSYPLYTLTAKLFSFLPLNDLAWRVNLFSAFWALGSLLFFYLILKELKIKKSIRFLVTLLVAISSTFWGQATYAEVYSLNIFFVSLLFWVLLLWRSSRHEKYLSLFSFLFGLSLTNHFSMLALLPGYLFFIFYQDRLFYTRWKLILKMFLLFILGLSLYVYIPLRSSMDPPIDWFNPERLTNFKHVLTYNLARGHIINANTFRYLGDFINQLLNQFPLLFIGLGLFGLFALFQAKQQRVIFYYLTLNIILLSFGVIVLVVNGLAFSSFIAWFLGLLYLPCYIYFAITIAFGFKYLSKHKLVFSAGLICSLLIISLLISNNWFINDKSKFVYLEDYSRELLLSLEPASILLVKEAGIQADHELFSLAFQKYVKQLRPDITIYSDTPVFLPPPGVRLSPDYIYQDERSQQRIFFESAYRHLQNSLRPLYTTFPLENLDIGLYTQSNGLAYKIYPSQDQASQDTLGAFSIATIESLDTSQIFLDEHSRMLIAKYFYSQSAAYLARRDIPQATLYLVKAIDFDPEPLSSTYRDFIQHRHIYLLEK